MEYDYRKIINTFVDLEVLFLKKNSVAEVFVFCIDDTDKAELTVYCKKYR